MILEILFATLIMSSAPADGRVDAASAPAAMKSVACDFFTHEAAAKILGRKATGIDGGMNEDTQTRSWKCTFSAADDVNGPKLYFMISKSISEEAATCEFDAIRQSNNKKPGFEEWPSVADEAVIHADGDNFKLVMVRKGVKGFRIKLNPAKGVSLDTVKDVAHTLAAKL